MISKICSYPSCFKTIKEGYRCDTHKTVWKGTRTQGKFYKTKRWQTVRGHILSIEPLCRECVKKGRTRIAKVVDHILSIRDGGDKTNIKNLQPLCHPCHNSKTSKEIHRRR